MYSSPSGILFTAVGNNFKTTVALIRQKNSKSRGTTPHIHQKTSKTLSLTKAKMKFFVSYWCLCVVNLHCELALSFQKIFAREHRKLVEQLDLTLMKNTWHKGNKSSNVFSFLFPYCRNLEDYNRFWEIYQKTEPVLPPCHKMRKYTVLVRRHGKLNHPLASAWSITCKGSCKWTLKCWITK